MFTLIDRIYVYLLRLLEPFDEIMKSNRYYQITCPENTTMGVPSDSASCIGVIVLDTFIYSPSNRLKIDYFVAPGPDVTNTTQGFPLLDSTRMNE